MWPGSWGWSPIRTSAWGEVRRRRHAAVERGDRDGQLAVDVTRGPRRSGVVGHPGEAVGGESDLIAAGRRVGPGDVVADLPAKLGQEPALAGEELGPAPGAKPGHDTSPGPVSSVAGRDHTDVSLPASGARGPLTT